MECNERRGLGSVSAIDLSAIFTILEKRRYFVPGSNLFTA